MSDFWGDDEKLESYVEKLSDTGNPADDSITERKIDFDLIYVNDFNRDANREIESLYEDIVVTKTLVHNLVVKDDGEGQYMLVSGERRWRAINLIRERNPELYKENFAQLVCKVIGKNVDMLKVRIMSYVANKSVAPTLEEEAKDLDGMRKLHAQMIDRGDAIDPNFFNYISTMSNRSKRQVQKIISIEDYLIEELKPWYYNGAFDTNAATVIAHYDDAVQREALKFLQQEGDKLSKENTEYLKKLNDQLKAEYGVTFTELMKAKVLLNSLEIKEAAGIDLSEGEIKSEEDARAIIREAGKSISKSVEDIKKKEKKKKNDSKPHGPIGKLEMAISGLKGKKLSDEDKSRIKALIQVLNEYMA